MQNKHDKYLLKITDDVNEMCTIIHDLKKDLHDVTIDRDKYKSEIERLEKEHENDLFKFATVGIASFVLGTGTGWWLRGEKINPVIPPQSEDENNTAPRYEIIPVFEQATLQPDTNYSASGVPSGVQASPILYSEAVSQNNTVAYDTGYDVSSHQQNTVSHLVMPCICHWERRQTTTSGSSYSGDCVSTSVTIRSLQDRSPMQYYSPPKTIVYFNPLAPPVPSELIGFFGWIPIRQMDYSQSTLFLWWMYTQIGYKATILPKSHDKGGDILLEGFGEIIIIQIKHRKEHTGIHALGEVLLAKKIYHATKARVISFSSPFTQDCLKAAENAEVELIDQGDVVDELRRNNIYYPID